MVLEGTIYKVCSGDSSPPSHQQQQSIFQTLLLMQSHLKGSHSFGLVIPDCELYWTHVQISTQAIEKASME